MRNLYRLVFWLALPFALLRLLWRARRQPAYLQHWRERFGFSDNAGITGAIWIHAVSVGETRAAEPLIRAMRTRHPELPILLTCMTPTGRETAAQLFGPEIRQCYLPYDLVPALRRFLRTHRPRMAILMETEWWPELMYACRQDRVPLFIVNARLSERSARRYAHVRSLMGDALRTAQGIAAQSADDAARLRALGAERVHVTGNLKFDRSAQPGDVQLAEIFRHRFAGRAVVLAASTRPGEEQMLLRAWTGAERGTALLIIVPRHPQRFDEVAELIRQAGLTCQRRSDEAAVASGTQAWLGDSMGEMFAYFAACDVALIGGSFLEFGGQNLLEACAVGKPVLFGPHMYNFSEASRLALQAGAARQVEDAEAAIIEALQLLRSAGARDAMGTAGRALMKTHQGATLRVLELMGL